jgi:hypothetical protein
MKLSNHTGTVQAQKLTDKHKISLIIQYQLASFVSSRSFNIGAPANLNTWNASWRCFFSF